MVTFIKKYTAYNYWATEQFNNILCSLSDEQLTQKIESSFPSISATYMHLWDAQMVWQNRINDIAITDWPSKSFNGSFAEAMTGMLESCEYFKLLGSNITEPELSKVIHYATFAGMSTKSTLLDILHHLMNHGTYHRGQLTTFLRQLGFTKIPSTDFITFTRL